MNTEFTLKAVTEKFEKLNALPSWVFYPHKKPPKNWRQMRDSTRVFIVKPSCKGPVRSGCAQVNVTSTSRLKHMASRHVQVIPSSEPLHENVIFSDLPVQRRARRDSVEGEALIADYDVDLARRPPPAVISPTRVNDRT